MATVGDLKNALKRVLTQNGALNRIEAQAKFEIFSALDSTVISHKSDLVSDVDEATYIINELILEYLKFSGLKFSESVFRSELRHKYEPMSRRLLCRLLNVKPTVSAKVPSNKSISPSGSFRLKDQPVPLLYYFVEFFKSKKPLEK